MIKQMDEVTLHTVLADLGLPVDAIRRTALPTGVSLYSVPVSHTAAFDTWRQLRVAVDQTGFWPLLTHRHNEFSRDDLEEGRSADTVIAASMNVDPLEWIAQREHERATWLMEHGYDVEEESVEEGSWPEDMRPNDDFYFLHSISLPGRQPQVPLLCLVPTTEPCTVPAYVPFGGWNDCPSDEVQIAFLRRWYERFGAELVAMTYDTLEFTVSWPPRTREEALALAREHYGYCADIVNQGTETISNLAASLLNGHVWFFWWD